MPKNRILKSFFFKNVLKISSGTLLAQILMLIGMPIITRLYSKDVIGVYALFTSTIGIVTTFVTLAYDNAIVLPKKKEDASAILKIVIYISLVLSFLIGVVLLIPLDFFSEYKSIAFFISTASFFQVLVTSMGYFKVRNNLFNELSFSKVVRNTVLLIFQIGLYYITNIYGLLIGFIIASVCTIIYLIYRDEHLKKAILSRQNIQTIMDNANTYKEYPMYFCWSNLILALSAGIPVILFNEYFSLSKVAIYSIAFSLIVQPAGLISASIRPVLLSRFANEKNNLRSIKKLYDKIFSFLILGSIIISIIIFFCYPIVITFVFGKNWEESGFLTRYLIPVFMWYFISIPSSITLKVYPFQKYAFIYTICSFIITIGFILLGINFGINFYYVVLVFSSSSLIVSLINHFVVRKKIINYEKISLS
ncbi:oligosaccharide flippase family protein [Aquimarina sp. 2201CG1-2-11]|uniref:oligosaccharide flippase family protein n=1 Tax=Aquimarina discodermiae TaxID=3231043 RepID=UPI003463751A